MLGIKPEHARVLGTGESRQNTEHEVPDIVIGLVVLEARVIGEFERFLEGVPQEQPLRSVLDAEVLWAGPDGGRTGLSITSSRITRFDTTML